MPNNLSSINFVGNKQISLFDKFMNWILTIGRLIVIITEVVAVIAFVYRFSLDEQLVNLHSAIKQKQDIISVSKNDENKYRNLQDRIVLVDSSSKQAANFNQIFTDIINLIPGQIKINDLILNKDRINLSIDIGSISSLGIFVDSLKSYHSIKSINIDNIENRPSAGLSVNITAMLK